MRGHGGGPAGARPGWTWLWPALALLFVAGAGLLVRGARRRRGGGRLLRKTGASGRLQKIFDVRAAGTTTRAAS